MAVLHIQEVLGASFWSR